PRRSSLGCGPGGYPAAPAAGEPATDRDRRRLPRRRRRALAGHARRRRDRSRSLARPAGGPVLRSRGEHRRAAPAALWGAPGAPASAARRARAARAGRPRLVAELGVRLVEHHGRGGARVLGGWWGGVRL